MPIIKEPVMTMRAQDIASRVEAFVRDVVIPYERDPRMAVHRTIWSRRCVRKRARPGC